MVTGYTTIIEGKAEFVNDYFIAINGDTLILPTPMGFEYLKTDFGENLIADKEKNKEALIKSNPKLYLAFVKSENVNLSKYYLLSPDGSAKKLSDGYLSRSFDHEYFTILKGEGRVNRDSLYYVIFNNEGKLIGNSIKDYLILNDNSTLIFSINDSIIYYDGKNHASLAYYISAYPSELYSNAIKFHNINELPVKADSNTINFIDINTRKVTISGIQGIKALPFINGKAALLRNGLWGAIDRKLDTIVPFIYTRISESIHYKMLLICNNKGCFDFMKKAEKVINPEDDITVYVKYTFYGQKYSSVDPVYFASVLTKQKYLDDLSVQEYVDSQVINWLTTEGKNWFYDKYIKEKSDPKNFKEVWQRKSVEITSENKWIDFRDLVKEYPEYGVAVIITYL